MLGRHFSPFFFSLSAVKGTQIRRRTPKEKGHRCGRTAIANQNVMKTDQVVSIVCGFAFVSHGILPFSASSGGQKHAKVLPYKMPYAIFDPISLPDGALPPHVTILAFPLALPSLFPSLFPPIPVMRCPCLSPEFLPGYELFPAVRLFFPCNPDRPLARLDHLLTQHPVTSPELRRGRKTKILTLVDHAMQVIRHVYFSHSSSLADRPSRENICNSALGNVHCLHSQVRQDATSAVRLLQQTS